MLRRDWLKLVDGVINVHVSSTQAIDRESILCVSALGTVGLKPQREGLFIHFQMYVLLILGILLEVRN